MRYEPPCIARREPLQGLLDTVQSNGKPDTGISDVHAKDNIAPVTWGDEPTGYTAPGIAGREPLEGLLSDAAQSNVKPGQSDVNLKDNIVPVRW